MDGTLVLGSDGKVRMNGVDYGGRGQIIAQNKGVIAVKWPAHMGWYARGERKYYSAEICVFQKVKTISETEWRVEELISWDVKRQGATKSDCLHRLERIDEPPFRYKCVLCSKKFKNATGMVIR